VSLVIHNGREFNQTSVFGLEAFDGHP